MVNVQIISSIIFDKIVFYEVVNDRGEKFLAEEQEIHPASLVKRYKKAHPNPIKAWEVEEIININLDDAMVHVKWKPSPPGPGKPIKNWENSWIYFGNLYCPKLITRFQRRCRPEIAEEIEEMKERLGHVGLSRGQADDSS
uniref:Chromo domain-containing protein n=1 Tax=Panagrolaimus sp. PS1159 TaxID=55785 RepID=A0AC35FH07_9BILA